MLFNVLKYKQIMNYPKISIVTPNYNKGEFLEYTIKSVLSQNYPNLEYIIIDGGSTDNSIDIIKKYQDRLAYWVSEPDKGMYDAIKKGFSHSSGEIMAWIGSDDMFHPNSFNIVAEIFQNKDINWLVGATTHFDVQGRCVSVSRSRYFSRAELLSGNYRWIQQESSFWRRTLYDKVGGLNAALKLAGDFDLWLRFSRYEKMYICNALLGGFRINNKGQLSLLIDKYEAEVNECIKKECWTEDLRLVRLYKRRQWILNLISRFRIFNTTGFARVLMQHEFQIANKQTFSFNRELQKFVLPK